MIHALFSLLSKISLFVLSAFAGVVGYLIAEATDFGENEESAPAPAHQAAYREISFPAQPALLARANNPIDAAGDALGTIYILEKKGGIVRVEAGATAFSVSTRYADLATEATEPGLGFSAIAFHPEFLVPERPGYGRFYAVVAERPGSGRPDFIPEFGHGTEHHQDVIYEFRADHPLAANFRGERREVVRFSQPGPDHNLGSLAFDGQGYLYLAVGDGGNGEIDGARPSRNASSLTSAYGKILRIDPVGTNSINGRYGIPESNPFRLVTDSLAELWAFGLRSPGNLSFDPYQRSLCIGETASDGTTRVNVSLFGGEHYGWDLEGGDFFFNLAMKSQIEEIVTAPAFRLAGERPAGNLIYRGESFPSLAGRLVLADANGRLVVSQPGDPNPALLRISGFPSGPVNALRSTPTGELLVLSATGRVYELRKSESVGDGKSSDRTLYCAR